MKQRDVRRFVRLVAGLVVGLVAALPVASAAPLDAQDDKAVTHVVETGQTVRDIAGKYFDDPDLWPEILRQNQLDSVDEVRPGTRLRIARDDITLAAIELSRARKTIESATRAGARVLAAETVGEAIELRNQALAARRDGEWKRCREFAGASHDTAQKALAESRERRQVAAYAVLVRRRGTVESRKPADLVWRDTPQGAKLAEGEKVRTLSDSGAGLRFPDQSRIDLEESSQAVIRTLRSDALSHAKTSKVTLEGGDLQAVLKNRRRKKAGFDLAIPGVVVKTDSNRFFASRRQEKVRIANYEDSEMQISSRGSSLVLGKDQGTVFREGGDLGAARDLLPAPNGLEPPDEPVDFKGDIELRWRGVAGAVRYWVEIAEDSASFEEIVVTEKDLRQPRFRPRGLATGLYYWRVAAFDSDALPGPKSETASFRVLLDETPPFLAVESPRDGARVTGEAVELVGEVESTAVLEIDGRRIDADAEGRFRTRIALPDDAPRTIELEAVDDAGNVTRRGLTVRRPPADHRRAEDGVAPEGDTVPPRLWLDREPPAVTSEPGLALAGRLDDAVRLLVDGEEVVLVDGRFSVDLVLATGENRVRLEARDAAGNPTFLERRIVVDSHPPELLGRDVSTVAAGAGATAYIRVEARDASGLRRVARFTLEAGGELYHGHLELDRTGGRYEGVVALAAGARERPRLSSVRLEDEHGQAKEYTW